MTADAKAPSSTAAIALLLMWSMAGYSTAADNPPASGPVAEPMREIRYAPRLRANLSNAERYVVKGVCEHRGLREISQILRHSDVEEMWVFLPRAQGTRDCQWHEIGREEKAESDRSTLRVDMKYLLELMGKHTEIHLVHFHPLKHFECAARGACQKLAAAGQTGALDKRWITDLVYSMPSPSDVHFMMNVTSRFFRRHQGQGTIKHKVVTPYGIVDYGLTEKGLAKYDSERHGRSEGLYITWVVASALDDDRIELVVKEDPRSLGAAVERLARTLNTRYLRVEHIPASP